jgi:hypothetical protein
MVESGALQFFYLLSINLFHPMTQIAVLTSYFKLTRVVFFLIKFWLVHPSTVLVRN